MKIIIETKEEGEWLNSVMMNAHPPYAGMKLELSTTCKDFIPLNWELWGMSGSLWIPMCMDTARSKP